MRSSATSTDRYAVYFAPPPGTGLHALGVSWLARDAFVADEESNAGGGPAAGFVELPRRYGFHATLKPPFTLKDGFNQAALSVALQHLASSLDPVTIPSLGLKQIDGFLALVPASQCLALGDLAAICVRDLDGFRAPLSDADTMRRRAAGLSKLQEDYLLRWGYPYVLDEFRFHMTLTRRLSEGELQQVEPLARRHFEPVLGRQLDVDTISLFMEPRPGQNFMAVQQFPLRRGMESVA